MVDGGRWMAFWLFMRVSGIEDMKSIGDSVGLILGL